MSRWPPEIAGTISHPGRKKRRHRRKSSNLLFSTFFFGLPPPRPTPSSTSDIFSLLSPFCPPVTGLGVLARYNVSGPRIERSRFHPEKKDERGGRRWPEARKKADAPTTPTYLRYPLSCPSFPRSFTSSSSESLAASHPFLPPGYFRTRSRSHRVCRVGVVRDGGTKL